MRRSIHVVAAYIQRDGRVLLDRRRKGSHLADTWEFPGGKREAGESDHQALIREIAEELGVAAEVSGPPVARVEHAYPEFDLTLVLYPVKIVGEPRAVDVAEIEWFDPGQLDALPMPPADRPLVDAIRARARHD